MLSTELIKNIVSLYKIAENVDIKKIEKGFLSENYRIETKNEKYFLKKYRFKDEGRIKEVHAVKSYFYEGGIPVIMPIKTKNGDTYFSFQNSHFGLFPFVQGVQPERGGLSKSMIVSLGKMLANMHLLGKDADVENSDVYSGWSRKDSLNTVKKIEEKLKKIKNKSEFDLLARKIVSLKKELISKNDIKCKDLNLQNDHLVHGDYLDKNVFFNEDENIKYVFDFEKAGYKPRTLELFRSVTYSFLNTDFNQTSIANVKLYLKSYLEVYPMDEEELKKGLKAYYLKSIHGFWVEKEHYLKDNNRVDVFLEPGYKRIKFMSERLNSIL